jgi:hypothetical protein
MKKYILTIAVLWAAGSVFAQNRHDVALYGDDDLNGTARYQSMSGAFGALGGDISALNINPAGSAVFTSSAFSVSAGYYGNNTESNYFNKQSEADNSEFRFNQAGGVFVFNNMTNSPWKKFALGVGYELNNSFDNEYLISGNGNSSIASFFRNNAEGVPLEELEVFENENITDRYIDLGHSYGYAAQLGLLGYQNYIINPVSENADETQYVSNAEFANNLYHNQHVYTSGFNSKFMVNFSTQFTDQFYFGAGLNFHSVEREKITHFDESGYSDASNLQHVQFDNELFTYGNGFSFNLGAIGKLNDMIRVGASYQSPTWYSMTDELYHYINTDYYPNAEATQVEFSENTPSTTLVFPDYKIQIPGKWTASTAFVFGTSGLISVDYQYQDMSNAKLKPDNDSYFAAENQLISNEFKATSTIRVGGEYRLNKLSLRAGYRFEESPYKDGFVMGDLNGYSAGIGYTFGPSRLDLGFSQSQRDYNQQLYDTGLNSTAELDNKRTRVVLSYTFSM